MKRCSIPGLGAMMIAAGLTMSMGAAAQQMGAETPIYGSELMTQQERLEYRDRLRQAQTAEERERIRSEHHEQMTQRARDRGVSLPDMPPGARGGMGSGAMPGAGYDGRQRMEEQRMEHREQMQEQMEHRQRMQDSDGSDYRRGSGMGGGGRN